MTDRLLYDVGRYRLLTPMKEWKFCSGKKRKKKRKNGEIRGGRYP